MSDSESEYFKFYGNLEIHRAMLMDSSRMDAYWKAIFDNKSQIEGKVVLDVGAGTGILSIFCAQAGAKKVYAVEASGGLIETLKSVIKDNNCEAIVEVIEGEIENVDIKEPVDILISEWMGQFLLHEGMLDSVLNAKRFLSRNGVIIPRKATIYMALCDMPDLVRNWSLVKNVNLLSATLEYRKEAAAFPVIEQIKPENLISTTQILTSFDLYSATAEDTQLRSKRTIFVPQRPGIVEGLCFWWNVQLSDDIVLSTSPESPPTHWKQAIVLLPKAMVVNKEMSIALNVTLKRISVRRYEIILETFDSENEDHDIPCDCHNTICKIAKKYYLETQSRFESEE